MDDFILKMARKSFKSGFIVGFILGAGAMAMAVLILYLSYGYHC